MDKIIWTTQKRKISELNPAKYNPRQLTEKQMQDLSVSLEKFNLADPIVINANNTIIGGHQRINILKAKYGNNGLEVDVRIPNRLLTQDEEVELNLRLNKNLGEWDLDALANFDEELLKDIGFESKELDRIFQLDTTPEDDDVPESAPSIAKLGDIWQLGRHRVMCGDSTVREDVERLMNGKKADMVFTSPPYNLGVSAQLRGNTAIGKRGNCYEEYDDNQLEDVWLNLINKAFEVWVDNAKYLFVNLQSLAGNRRALWKFINQQLDYFCDVAIWNKSFAAPQLARQVMNSCFEFIFIFTKDNPNRAIRISDFRGTVNNVFNISPQRKNEFSNLHGATFPVELPVTIIENFSKRESDTIICDCFLGSGSTLIACEKTNRICYGMEIDPLYCDVIIKRWEDYTGKKAVKLNG